jgi:transcriptional regulator with XRE-family HTH domain
MKFSSLTNFSSFFDEFIFVTAMQIHQLLKKERVKANLTEDEMAEILGISRSTYQYWEKKTPAVDKIKAVAKALNLAEDYFFINSDENLISDNERDQVNEPEAIYSIGNIHSGKDQFLALLLEEKDRSIKRAEESAQKAEQNAIKMETHYEDAKSDKEKLFIALSKLQNTFDSTLKEISLYLKEAAVNLNQNNQQLAQLADQTYIVSDQLEHQRQALNLGFPGQPKKQPAAFVKKGKAAGGLQQDGGKKNKDH